MKVEIFSDVVCPWCAIGKRRFETALEGFDHSDEVEIQWRAFELDPDAPPETEGSIAAHLAAKYGMSIERARESQRRLAATAEIEGLEFNFENTRRANTFDSHRLLHYAYEVGVQDALKERLFRAYFTEGKSISDHETLVKLGEEVGLDPTKTAELLASDRYAAEVRSDENEARQLRISGVPFFIVDRKYGISGAQNPDTILQVLEEAWAESHPLFVTSGDPDASCEGDSCQI